MIVRRRLGLRQGRFEPGFETEVDLPTVTATGDAATNALSLRIGSFLKAGAGLFGLPGQHGKHAGSDVHAAANKG